MKNYMLINEFAVKEEAIERSIKSWKKLYRNEHGRVLYKRDDGSRLLEIVLLARPASIEDELSSTLRQSYQELIKPDMLTDWRMQLLALKNKVNDNGELLPNTPYLQLRYIEVPLSVYDEYFQWRRPTIFEYVERFSQIEYFMAYHSVLSTKPGVMFLSGFSGDVEEYLNIFKEDEFQAISNEAKSKYIHGGDQGLSTLMYVKV